MKDHKHFRRSLAAKRRDRNHRYYMKRRLAATERQQLFRCRLPTQLIATLQRMVTETARSGKYGFNNLTEAAVEVIRRGIGTFQTDYEFIEAAWPGIEASKMLDDVARQRKAIQTMVERLHQEVSEFKGIGAERSALQYYHAVMGAIQKMPPTAHRDWGIKKLESEFPTFAKNRSVPGVVVKLHHRKKKA